LVTLALSTHARPAKHNELWSACHMISERCRNDSGCLKTRLYRDPYDQNLIHLEQTWARNADLDAYFRSDVFGALMGAVKLLGESHAIRINDGSETEGLEAVQRARSRDHQG
jgi:quinol monooxygenase YgiN